MIMDIIKYPEGPQEIIKYMGYLPLNDEERLSYLMAYVMQVLFM
jgi:hypothetical protein